LRIIYICLKYARVVVFATAKTDVGVFMYRINTVKMCNKTA